MISPTKTLIVLLAGGGKGLQELIDDDHQRRDDRHLHNDANAARDVVPNRADCGVGKSKDHRHGNRHDDRRFELGRYRQGRTNTEHLQGDRVAVEQRVQQDVFGFVFSHLCLLLGSLLVKKLAKTVGADPVLHHVRQRRAR